MAEMLEVRPTEATWVEETISQNKSTYSETHKLIDQMRRLRYMRAKARPPRAFQRLIGKGIRSPLSYNLVQTITGMIVRERPKYSRVPRSGVERQKAQTLANSADPMMQSFEQIAHRPLFFQWADQAVSDGRVIGKIRRVPWEGYPLRKAGEKDKDFNNRVAKWVMNASTHPIRATIVDAMGFMPDRNEWEPQFVIETGNRPTLPTFKALGVVPTNEGFKQIPTDKPYPDDEIPTGTQPTVPVEELWTPDALYIRVAREQVLKFPNDFGFIPYAWNYGATTSHNDPALEGMSVLYPYLGLEPWVQMLLGVLASWSIVGGTPILVQTTDRTAGASNAGAIADVPLNKMVTLPPGGDMKFVQPPPVGREIIEFIQLLMDFIDRAGITPLAQGHIGTRTPGLTVASALEAASGKLIPIKSNLENFHETMVKMSWKTVYNNIKQPIHVTGTGLVERDKLPGRRKGRGRFIVDPKDIDDYYDIKAELSFDTIQDEIAKGTHAATMKAHRLWGKRRAMRFSGVDDPEDEIDEIALDELSDTPVVRTQIIQQAIQDEPELQKIQQDLADQGVDIVQLLVGGGAPGADGQSSGQIFQGGDQAPVDTGQRRGGRPPATGTSRGGGTGGARARQRRTVRTPQQG
jgi:hypothetical protein